MLCWNHLEPVSSPKQRIRSTSEPHQKRLSSASSAFKSKEPHYSILFQDLDKNSITARTTQVESWLNYSQHPWDPMGRLGWTLYMNILELLLTLSPSFAVKAQDACTISAVRSGHDWRITGPSGCASGADDGLYRRGAGEASRGSRRGWRLSILTLTGLATSADTVSSYESGSFRRRCTGDNFGWNGDFSNPKVSDAWDADGCDFDRTCSWHFGCRPDLFDFVGRQACFGALGQDRSQFSCERHAHTILQLNFGQVHSFSQLFDSKRSVPRLNKHDLMNWGWYLQKKIYCYQKGSRFHFNDPGSTFIRWHDQLWLHGTGAQELVGAAAIGWNCILTLREALDEDLRPIVCRRNQARSFTLPALRGSFICAYFLGGGYLHGVNRESNRVESRLLGYFAGSLRW